MLLGSVESKTFADSVVILVHTYAITIVMWVDRHRCNKHFNQRPLDVKRITTIMNFINEYTYHTLELQQLYIQ